MTVRTPGSHATCGLRVSVPALSLIASALFPLMRAGAREGGAGGAVDDVAAASVAPVAVAPVAAAAADDSVPVSAAAPATAASVDGEFVLQERGWFLTRVDVVRLRCRGHFVA